MSKLVEEIGAEFNRLFPGDVSPTSCYEGWELSDGACQVNFVSDPYGNGYGNGYIVMTINSHDLLDALDALRGLDEVDSLDEILDEFREYEVRFER